jgi:L-lactate transport
MWQQNYAPVAQSIGWSAAGASVPMLVLLVFLALWRRPAWISAIASLAAAGLMARWLYGMPPTGIIAAASYGAAFGLLPIGWITLNAILLYRITLETGQFEVIKSTLSSLTADRRLQALLIAFAFGAFIEGAAGSGVPVAVGAAMLTGLGFGRLQAAGICLLANTAPVAFGAIGTPILTLAITTGLPVSLLSSVTGRLCAPLSLCVPTYLTVLVAGWKGLRGALPAALLCGVSFAAVQLAVSNLVGPQLTDILAALVAMASLVLLFRVWQPKDRSLFGAAQAASGTAPPASEAPNGLQSPRSGSGSTVRLSPSEIWRAWLPYMLLAGCVLLWGFQPVHSLLISTSASFRWPALHNQILQMPPVVPAPVPYAAQYRLDWLASPGTACLVASLLGAAFAGLSPKRFGRVFASTLKQMFLPLVTIVSVLALAFLMNYCGATATLGLAFAATGRLFPFFSAMLGWMGVFLTGSDASCNALFGNLQVVTARRLGLSPILMASANSAGGVMGKMISVQSIAVAAAATRMKTSEEAQLFRFTFWHSLLLASAIGLLTAFYAYAIPAFVR